MLRDRRILIEKELARAQSAAAQTYLDIMINDGDTHSVEYQTLKDRVMSLTFDLTMVTDLINQGHE